MPSGSHVLPLRLAAGRPGQRVALARDLGEEPGLREGDQGTVLSVDDHIHLEMDAGLVIVVDDPEAVRRLGVPSPELPAVPPPS